MESFQSAFLKVPLIWLIQPHSLEKNLELQSYFRVCVARSGLHARPPQRFPSRSRTQSGSTLRTRARGPLFRAPRSRARREDWRADWLLAARPAARSRSGTYPGAAIGGAAVRAPTAVPRAPPRPLQRATVAWGAAGGRGSVTALRRALGGIVAVSGAESGPERGPTLRAPQSKCSLRLSAGGLGARGREVPPVLQRPLPSPRSPGGEGSGASAAASAVPRGPAPCRLLLANCGGTPAGPREWVQRWQGVGSPGKRRRASVPAGGAPAGRSCDVFRSRSSAVGIRFRSGSRRCQPQSMPPGLRGARESPTLCNRQLSPLSLLYFPQSPPAARAEGRRRGAIGCGFRGVG